MYLDRTITRLSWYFWCDESGLFFCIIKWMATFLGLWWLGCLACSARALDPINSESWPIVWPCCLYRSLCRFIYKSNWSYLCFNLRACYVLILSAMPSCSDPPHPIKLLCSGPVHDLCSINTPLVFACQLISTICGLAANRFSILCLDLDLVHMADGGVSGQQHGDVFWRLVVHIGMPMASCGFLSC